MTSLHVVLWLLAGTPLAQQQASPTGSVSGTVVDSVSGAPVRKAQVSMTGDFRETAITDVTGGFTIESVPPGTLIVRAQHADYPQGFSWFPANVKFRLAPGERKSGIEIRLRPAASLGGRVVDADGDPLTGCNVLLLSGPGRVASPGTTVTNKKGEYVFDRVAVGKYYIQAKCSSPYLQPRPFAPPEAVLPGSQLGYSPRYYPNAAEIATAQKINALAGQSLRGIDFRFSPQTLSSLGVRIAGASPTGIRASLIVPPSASSGQTRGEERYVAGRNTTGAILITGVVPGTYLLRITTMTSDQVLLASQTVEVTDQSKTITVNVISPMRLSGTVIADPEKENVATNKVRRPNQHRLWLIDSEDPSLNASADIQPDGSFQLQAITPGHYRVTIPNGAWVQSVAIGGVLSDGPDVEIRAGSTGPLEIHTGQDGGTVSGDLLGLTQGVAQVRIIAASAGPSNLRLNNDLGMFSASPPRFSVRMQAGRYRLYVAELDAGEDAGAVVGNETLLLRGEEVDVRAGKETIRNLKVITAADIRKENQ